MKNETIKRLFLFIILGAFLLSVIPVVSAQTNIISNMYFGLEKLFSDSFGTEPGDIIVSIVIAIILFAVFYDLLTLIPFFNTEWVKYIIAGGVAVIGIIFRWPILIAEYGLGLAAGLGAIGFSLVLILLAAMLIGLAFGRKWALKFAMKRRATMHEIRAAEGAAEAGAAIDALKFLDTKFENKK